MARPRVFVSSTYYDLKHIRSSLDAFIESLGYESVLSEKGDIAYSPDAPLDESCYRDAEGADIFVLIIGGRYGSEASNEEREDSEDFFERYDSITKKEFRAAIENDVPTYILVDSAVYAEYRTFQKNRKNEKIAYAHVDSANIFHLLDEVLALRRNNPVQSFERSAEIESWLREQWSGLFKDFLSKHSQQQQLTTLSSKVEELGEVNRTLRRYIEAIITKLSPDESEGLIDEEQKRLERAKSEMELRHNGLFDALIFNYEVELDDIIKAAESAKSLRGFASAIKKLDGVKDQDEVAKFFDDHADPAIRDLNEARQHLGLKLVKK